jgi:trk system potassium uptake protein TrkH
MPPRRRPPISVRIGRRINPPRALLISFGLLILLGAAALLLPCMSREGLAPIDALFTATSAVCVTGLVVVDTGRDLTLGGQWIVMILIQLGGLGIMTFSLYFLRLLGQRSTLTGEMAVRSALSVHSRHALPDALTRILVFTFGLELIGAAFLFFFFLPGHSGAQALWLAVFHAVSAFCNAGFTLFSDSLVGYHTHWGVNLTVMGLIVLGGLGFMVLVEISDLPRRKMKPRLSLHTKIVLVVTAALVVLGFAAILIFEWNHQLAAMSWPHKALAALFQSVTTRTAGFNTVEVGRISNPTLLVFMGLMFIGGSPGSTAGGIKTVTVAVIAAAAISRFRGFTKVNLFKRGVPDALVSRALAMTLVSLAIVAGALIAILSSEFVDQTVAESRETFIELVFETVSAFGTVGLSMGATGHLTDSGKLIIILTMFLGRLGPLTAALAMMRHAESVKPYNYGPEEVMVG